MTNNFQSDANNLPNAVNNPSSGAGNPPKSANHPSNGKSEDDAAGKSPVISERRSGAGERRKDAAGKNAGGLNKRMETKESMRENIGGLERRRGLPDRRRANAKPMAKIGAGNAELFERARRVIPGGVNSPVRAFRGVGGTPRFIARALGARMWDVEGREYIDFIGSWGPMILGHGHPEVVEAIRAQALAGTSFGAPSEIEVEMAGEITRRMPGVEVVRMVNSGTEATMSAIRLARAAAGRDLIVKSEGCYHGHADAFLSRAGSGAATLGVPDSPGVPASIASTMLNARYNDLDSVERLFDAHAGRIAAIIVEPVAGNMGVVPPRAGFLEGLRKIANSEGALLIFDEVMTGFRVAPGGAQERYGVRPDLTALGKIIGGGLPVGAYGGRAELMNQVAPAGPVYQAGTLSGNPLSMAAGLATLRALGSDPEIYERLESLGAALQNGLDEVIRRGKYPACVQRVGSMLTLFFHPGPIKSWDDANACDRAVFARFFHAMLDQGIHLPPSQFEAWFLSAAHTESDIARTIEAAAKALDRAGAAE